jgi:short-subunit dehydrogenase
MKKIWITGASSGIGRALSLKFAKEGWLVASSARREKLLQEISKIDNNITPFPLDVTNSEKCKEVFAQIKKKFNDIDVVLFCAGIHDPELEKDFNLENIQKIMNVNFFGVINSINSVYDYFKEKKNGHISIISSVAGYRGLPSSGAYCSSKSAITTFAESLYFDLNKFNVKVSVISPGFIKTAITNKNKFYMPMLKSPEYAAEKIFIGLTTKNNFELHFPKPFTYLMKIIKILPYTIFFKIQIIANKFILKR